MFKNFFKKQIDFVSCMEGMLISLDDVPDEVFSSRSMGDGFAVDITGNTVVAPFDGEVTLCFPTGHAYGIRSKDGIEVLLHVGIDTVKLNGEGFEVLVKQGDKIKKGDRIVKLDTDFIKSKGKSLISPVIFTSGVKVKLLKENKKIAILDEDIVVY